MVHAAQQTAFHASQENVIPARRVSTSKRVSARTLPFHQNQTIQPRSTHAILAASRALDLPIVNALLALQVLIWITGCACLAIQVAKRAKGMAPLPAQHASLGKF